MKNMKQIGIVLVIFVGVICVYHTFWGYRLPRPTSTHDPLGVGYPPDPNKPPLVDQAEKYIVEGWDIAQSVVTPQYLEESYKENIAYSKKMHVYYLSPDEGRQYFNTVSKPTYYLSIAMGSLMKKHHISPDQKTKYQEAYINYLRDYIFSNKGIRQYYYDENLPENKYTKALKADREALLKSGAINITNKK